MAHTNLPIRLMLLAACTVGVIGCGSTKQTAAPPPPPPSIQLREIPNFPVRVLLGDKVLASFDRGSTGEYEFESDAEIKLDSLPDSDAVKAEGLHPDGWTGDVAEIFPDGNNPIIWVKFKYPRPEHWKVELSLQVDNRGGELTQIFVGHMPRAIKANSADKLFYPAPTKAQNAVVRIVTQAQGGQADAGQEDGDKEIGGQEAGTLWPEAEQPDWSKEEFFVDVTGTRSYKYREVYYSSEGYPVDALQFLNIKPVSGELSGKYLHRVPFSFSFLLQNAPETIQVKTESQFGSADVRTEILEK